MINRTYFLPRIDGFNDAMVAARTPERAAQQFGLSIEKLRELDWRMEPSDSPHAQVARRHPDVVLFKPIVSGVVTDWRETRWTREEIADSFRAHAQTLLAGDADIKSSFEFHRPRSRYR